MYKPVLTKADFTLRYQAGEFGNASPTWHKPDDFLAYGQREFGSEPSVGLYHLRNRIAGGATYYNLRWSETVARWLEQEQKEQWYVSAMCPTEKTIFQGEVAQTSEWATLNGRYGLDLFYSTVAKPMRQSLVEGGKRVHGVTATMLLRHYLTPSDYDWLQYLLDEYQYHVIEFTALSVYWGTVPGSKCLIWEVRTY